MDSAPPRARQRSPGRSVEKPVDAKPTVSVVGVDLPRLADCLPPAIQQAANPRQARQSARRPTASTRETQAELFGDQLAARLKDAALAPSPGFTAAGRKTSRGSGAAPRASPQAERAAVRKATDLLKGSAASKPPELPDERAQLYYQHALFCQIGIPRSAVTAPAFVRTCGNVSMKITPGSLWINGDWVDQCIPYGATPRLALAQICSYAVRNRTPVVPTGRSAAEFMQALGLAHRDTRTYHMLRKQIHALAACRIQFGLGDRTMNAQPVEHFDAWVVGAPANWPAELKLSPTYYETLLEHAVPLNMSALQALRESALAIDIYSWLAYRLHRLSRPTMLHWASLRSQFGDEYGSSDPRNFKREFKLRLAAALKVYPDARVHLVPGGIQIRPSKAAVPVVRIAVSAPDSTRSLSPKDSPPA